MSKYSSTLGSTKTKNDNSTLLNIPSDVKNYTYSNRSLYNHIDEEDDELERMVSDILNDDKDTNQLNVRYSF